ncbi:MAG: type II/IV secretion system protein, partial [Spirulinaceae cyanobacterium]
MQNWVNSLSAWQKLRNRHINCDQALRLLVDDRGIVVPSLLDREVSDRFFREFPNPGLLPPVVPLLLWQNCFYLGSPVKVAPPEIALMRDRTLTEIKIIPITEKSYKNWYHLTHYNPDNINATPLVNPLTGQVEQEDISETTELYLAKAVDQIGRIKTLISGALRNRASDIHLEPTQEGLRVRYRIDGVLRDITLLPLEISRRVVVALKVMS